jgi:hypothetical protein
MRLNSALVERTLHQFDAKVVPDDHPAMPKLVELFGDHTFFLDEHGLSIVEPADPADRKGQVATVVELASWTGAQPSGLVPHTPEPTETVIILGPES